MKKAYQLIKTGLVLSIASLAFAACSEDKMDDINRDLSVSTDVVAKFILPDVELRTAQNVVGGDFNTYFGSYVEYWAGTHNQLFKAEKRDAEVRIGSTYNNNWGTIYENIRNAKIIVDKSKDDSDKPDAFACALGEIMLAYNLAIATDEFGDTPYTQVGNVNEYPYPEADSQENLYKEIFDLLDSALKHIQAGSNTVGQYDFIYGGNKDLWTKFANGLKARYTMRLLNRSSNKNTDLQNVIKFVDASFANAGEQASMKYDGSNQNPVFDFEWSRDGISSCTSMHSKLVERNDPRGDLVYWDPSSWEHYDIESVVDVLAPTGSPEESQYFYAYDAWFFAEVAPIHFLSYHELQFLKAEAQVRLGQTDAAKETLKGAIKAAFANFNVNVKAAMDAPSVNAYGGIEPVDNLLTDDDAEGYFDTEVAPLFDANPFQETMLQKYLGLWGANGETVETYADIRRLKAEGKDVYGLVNPGKFPLRCPYGQDDIVANPNITKLYKDAGNYVFSDNVWWAGGNN